MSGLPRVIYVLFGGGPASGWNNCLRSVVLEAEKRNQRVVGVYHGFEHIREGNYSDSFFKVLTPDIVQNIAGRGGAILGTSRKGLSDPSHASNVLRILDRFSSELNAETRALVALGGNDTFVSANRVFEASRSRGQQFSVFHGTKTIDNDLFSPARACRPFPSCPSIALNELPSFGFSSSAERFAEGVCSAYFDARNNSGRYIVSRVMGRDAGWLTWAAAMIAHERIQSYLMPDEVQRGPIVLMKEMLASLGPISSDTFARIMFGAVLKDRLNGQDSGSIVMAEGVADCLDEASRKQLEAMMVAVDQCDHGHSNYSRLPFDFYGEQKLEAMMVSLGFGGDTRNTDHGYDGRCLTPNAYDMEITTQIGAGILAELEQGRSGLSVYGYQGGYECVPFADSLDPETQKMKVREVPKDLWVPLSKRFLQQGDLENDALAALAKMTPPEFSATFADAVLQVS